MVGFVSNPELFGVAHLTRLQGVSVAEFCTIDGDSCLILAVCEDSGFNMDGWHFFTCDILNRRHTSFYPLLLSIAYRFPSLFPRTSPWLGALVSPFVSGFAYFCRLMCSFRQGGTRLSLDYTNAIMIRIKTGYLQSITIWSYL